MQILSRKLNRILWIGMAVLLIVLGLNARDSLELYFAGVGRLDVRDEPEQATVWISWRGKIGAPMAERIAEAFAQYKGVRRRFVLALSSPGGSLDHGARVVELLRRIGETHALETVVDARRLCASMCVPVYLQGQRRTAAETARFMFHDVSFREFHSEDQLDVPESARLEATDRLFDRYFAPAGVPESWIRNIRNEMAGGRDVWKTARELVDENSAIVQQVF